MHLAMTPLVKRDTWLEENKTADIRLLRRFLLNSRDVKRIKSTKMQQDLVCLIVASVPERTHMIFFGLDRGQSRMSSTEIRWTIPVFVRTPIGNSRPSKFIVGLIWLSFHPAPSPMREC
jgi:hypothetical protein